MKTKYILTRGKLSRKDSSLCYRSEDQRIHYFPIEGIREIYIMNEVSVNTKLLDFLAKYRITLHFFNYYGNYSGTYYPKKHYISGRLLMTQIQEYNKDRIRIAKAIVLGIGENIIEVLYHYYRHGKAVKNYIDEIREILCKKLPLVEQINHILYLEGMIWEKFYNSTKEFLNQDFIIKKRIKRPPNNPINAMISFGNTLLYTKTISAIHQTHLDPMISYLHEPAERRFSLALDLSETFKPLIVFRTIFDLINNKKISPILHFEKEVNYALLNEEGRKIFISAFEERINKTIKHSSLGRKVSYQTLIKYEAYKLIKDIMEDILFAPYLEKRKK